MLRPAARGERERAVPVYVVRAIFEEGADERRAAGPAVQPDEQGIVRGRALGLDEVVVHLRAGPGAREETAELARRKGVVHARQRDDLVRSRRLRVRGRGGEREECSDAQRRQLRHGACVWCECVTRSLS